MFEKIPLTKYSAPGRLSSSVLPKETLEDSRYGKGNLSNAVFSILGTAEGLSLPPITDYALENLNYVQAFTVFHYQAPSFTKRHDYPSYLLAITYGGKGYLTYGGRKYSLEKGDIFFIDCMTLHEYGVESGIWDVAILHIQGPLCHGINQQISGGFNPVFHEPVDGPCQKLLETILRVYTSAQLYRDWQVSSHLTQLLTHLLLSVRSDRPDSGSIPTNIRYLVKYMENNYPSSITLDFLASFANMNKYYLSREFKKYTGFSPNDYLISLRINAAKELLTTTSLPAIKIAHSVGIHDANNFTNLFRKKTGMTPTAYRKSTSLG